MKTKVFAFIAGLFSKKILIILVAALPIFELRLAIPLGIINFNLPVLEVYFLSLIGNLLPVLPLLLFFKYFFHRLENLKFIGKLFSWWFIRVERKSKIVDKWGFWGLVLFVSIPLPITGAWTGTVAATLFGMKTKKAALAIVIGVSLAGVVVGALSLLCADFIRGWLTFI